MTGFADPLHRASLLLVQRLAALEGRVREGDEVAWGEFRETAVALAEIGRAGEAGRPAKLLTTKEMAERLGIAPKTLLRKRMKGQIRAAYVGGRRLIRWKAEQRGDKA